MTARRFATTDEDVVVVVGSGTGGGTLGNDFDDHPNDLAMREHAWNTGVAVHEAAGATASVRTPPYPSTHNLGTCRVSTSPEDGVVDSWGRAHDVPNLFVSDGNVFTTGAAANPTLTIVALVIRQAEYIADLVSKGDL